METQNQNIASTYGSKWVNLEENVSKNEIIKILTENLSTVDKNMNYANIDPGGAYEKEKI